MFDDLWLTQMESDTGENKRKFRPQSKLRIKAFFKLKIASIVEQSILKT